MTPDIRLRIKKLHKLLKILHALIFFEVHSCRVKKNVRNCNLLFLDISREREPICYMVLFDIFNRNKITSDNFIAVAEVNILEAVARWSLNWNEFVEEDSVGRKNSRTRVEANGHPDYRGFTLQLTRTTVGWLASWAVVHFNRRAQNAD